MTLYRAGAAPLLPAHHRRRPPVLRRPQLPLHRRQTRPQLFDILVMLAQGEPWMPAAT
jgi:hypothetical protein